MKKMKRNLLIVSLLFLAFGVQAQRINLQSGSMAPLKGEDVVEVVFTYEDMRVGRMTEEEYVAEKMQEEGGERFKTGWINDRSSRFEPKFVELFNKYAARAGIVLSPNNTQTRYVLIINTYFTEPGYNIGINSRPAMVSMTATFIERGNPDKTVAVFDITNSRGSTAFDRGHRIQESYAKAGKEFGRIMRRKLR